MIPITGETRMRPLMPDPPQLRVRGRGLRCAICRGPMPLLAAAERDPFCSTECCHAWHTPTRRAAWAWSVAHR